MTGASLARRGVAVSAQRRLLVGRTGRVELIECAPIYREICGGQIHSYSTSSRGCAHKSFVRNTQSTDKGRSISTLTSALPSTQAYCSPGSYHPGFRISPYNSFIIRSNARSYTESESRKDTHIHTENVKQKRSGTRDVDRVKAVNAKLSAFLDSSLLGDSKITNTESSAKPSDGKRKLPKMIKGKRIRPRKTQLETSVESRDHILDVPESRVRSHGIRDVSLEGTSLRTGGLEEGGLASTSDSTAGAGGNMRESHPFFASSVATESTAEAGAEIPMESADRLTSSAVEESFGTASSSTSESVIPDLKNAAKPGGSKGNSGTSPKPQPQPQPQSPTQAYAQTIIPTNRATTEQEMMDIMAGGYTWQVTKQMRNKEGELVSVRSNVDPLAVQASAEWKTRREVRFFLDKLKKSVKRLPKKAAAETCLALLAKEREMVPNGLGVITYTQIMGALAVVGNWRSAEQVITEMQQKGFPPNQITHNCMLDAYATGGRDELALALLRRLQRDNVPLNINSYNIVLKGILQSKDPKRFRNAEFLKDEMFAGKGDSGPEDTRILPNVFTYYAFIVRYAESKNWRKALDTYRSIPETIPMVRSTHSFVLDMLSRRKELRLMEEVFYAWQQKGAVGEGPVLDLRFSNPLLPALDFEHAREVGRQAASSKNKPTADIGIYNILIKGYAISAQTEITHHIFSALQAYEPGSKFAPNADTYTECIRAAVTAGELETAMVYFELLQEQSAVTITSDTYKLMIKACRKKPRELTTITNMMLNNLDSAVASGCVFYVLQTNKNVSPPQWQYSLGLFRHVHLGEPFSQLSKLFPKWECDNVFRAHYDLVNQTLIDTDRFEETVALYDDVKQVMKSQYLYRKTLEGRSSVPVTYAFPDTTDVATKEWHITSESANLIAFALANTGRVQDATELFGLGSRMKNSSRKGFQITDSDPTPETMSVLLKALGDAGDWQMAEKIFNESLFYGAPVGTPLYNAMLNVYGNTGQIQSMLAMIKEMNLQSNLSRSLTASEVDKTVSVIPNGESAAAIFMGLAKHPFIHEPWVTAKGSKCNFLDLVNQEWARMQKIGAEPSDCTYIEMFNALHAFSVQVHREQSTHDVQLYSSMHEEVLMKMIQALCAHDRASKRDIVNDRVLLSIFNNCSSDVLLQRVRQVFASAF